MGQPAYGIVKQRLRMARETLIRSGMAAELADLPDAGAVLLLVSYRPLASPKSQM